tara:strand:+ start:2501 stop:2734 length:234 start_codon:yes stop_codon:yes gene_type:complete
MFLKDFILNKNYKNLISKPTRKQEIKPVTVSKLQLCQANQSENPKQEARRPEKITVVLDPTLLFLKTVLALLVRIML